MTKIFNVNGVCRPDLHYMVDLSSRLAAIKEMVDEGAYFTINKARQYGKTTILWALAHFLQEEYVVVSLDFQRMSSLSFQDEQKFVASFSEELLYAVNNIPEEIASRLCAFADGTARLNSLQSLFRVCPCGVPGQKNQSFSSLMKWTRRPIIRFLWTSSRSCELSIFPVT